MTRFLRPGRSITALQQNVSNIWQLSNAKGASRLACYIQRMVGVPVGAVAAPLPGAAELRLRATGDRYSLTSFLPVCGSPRQGRMLASLRPRG